MLCENNQTFEWLPTKKTSCPRNAIYAGLAIFTWFFLQEGPETTARLSGQWIGFMLMRNIGFCVKTKLYEFPVLLKIFLNLLTKNIDI